ncbi:protein arginine N-methyltransferase 6 [Centroberyx affinis]|uniref:protein arginine N-methyltransferase 6 n=1 Tax=Centroberyx affinis TaxID=166261 RepID=UPI003A5C6732
MSHIVKKRKLDKNRQDSLYFDSYSDVTIHEEMIADHVRTNTYRTGILRNSESIRGKVVLDVGAGTGVLSIFCVQAGAKKVYAVEACSIAEEAVKIVKQNKMEDRIEVIRGTVETVDLPEMVEVIVSEWMGYALLHESMLNSVLYARDKWLKKPGGLILPSKAELYISPVSDPVVEDRLNFWCTVKDQYGVDMSCMSDFARRCIMNSDITVNAVTVEDVLSHPARFAELDLYSVTAEELQAVKGQFRCECFGSATVNALCVWFTVTFPCEDKPALVLSTSPFKPETHWKQAVLYLDAPVDVVQDTRVTGEVSMYPSEQSARHICIHVDYTIGEQKRHSKTFSIPDWSSEAQQ